MYRRGGGSTLNMVGTALEISGSYTLIYINEKSCYSQVSGWQWLRALKEFADAVTCRHDNIMHFLCLIELFWVKTENTAVKNQKSCENKADPQWHTHISRFFSSFFF